MYLVAAIIGLLVLVAVVKLLNVFGYTSAGNSGKYGIKTVKPLPASPLQGMNIAFLGSSVTYGSTAKGTSFVEYICKRNGCTYVKEALAGTTLVDDGEKSYVQRMLNKLDSNAHVDLFVVQLSTNDATKQLPLGAIGASFVLDEFDTTTVAGAIEYIIGFARQTWQCPVVFYTGTYYESERYGEMVNLLLEIQKKWDIGVIDLWHNAEMRAVDADSYKLYMVNGVHPSQAGYLLWWTPVMEKYLYGYLT